MSIQLLIAGGGIGGLAAALACARVGYETTVLEQGSSFSETGAGIQLGPNVTRILQHWSLGATLRECAAHPSALAVRDGLRGRELGRLELGAEFELRYGSPYLTVHRADLQRILLDAAREAGVDLRVDARVTGLVAADRVEASLQDSSTVRADALIAADGVWSTLRRHVIDDGPAEPTGHFAYRAVASQSALPANLRSNEVIVWLAPRMHVVSYPLRGGELLNVVILAEAPHESPAQGWEAKGAGSDLARAVSGVCPLLRELVDAMPSWGLWSLHDRTPLQGPHEMARGRIALLGDSSHPMLPYLAQGAGMAIEDAQVLAAMLSGASAQTVPQSLQRYAQARWKRCAQVQSRARRNATVFHASGPLRVARDVAMKAMGQKLLDQPWLYAR